MHRERLNPMPFYTSAKQLANYFQHCFTSKNNNIREKFFEDTDSAFRHNLERERTALWLTDFDVVSEKRFA